MEHNYSMEELYPYFKGQNSQLRLMNTRMGNQDLPRFKPDTVEGATEMAKRLSAHGGYPQQDRMIRDKRRSLDKAVLYSYQGALVKKQIYDFEPTMEGVKEAPPVRALINPNKLKQDYDDKVISIGFEHGFQTGDVFEWCNTKSHWLIYLQDLTELAYFKGDIRRCRYEIEWYDENEKRCRTYAAVRGPVETKIDYIQKHGISVDNPNFSLHLLMPKNKDTLKKFKRYSKFYLQGTVEGEENTCWRVEAIDSFSTPGILEINAVEYYANQITDDIDNGIVDAFVVKPMDPNPEINKIYEVFGETFIKPKKEYIYYIDNNQQGQWYIDTKVPVKYTILKNEKGQNSISLKWDAVISGQFDIWFGDKNKEQAKYKKTIVVESLF